MRRRSFVFGAVMGSVSFRALGLDRALAATSVRSDEDRRRKAIESFPFELVETNGRESLATWERLRAEGRGSPVVLGNVEDVARVTPLEPQPPRPGLESVPDLVEKADGLSHPEDLRSFFKLQRAQAMAVLLSLRQSEAKPSSGGLTISRPDGTLHLSFEEAIEYFLENMKEAPEPEIGPWRDRPPASAGLSVARDTLSDQPFDKVYVAVVPTEDWTTIPIQLRWGGWNDCPPAEYHVAALRSWRDRYGAELVGLSLDVMNLRVAERPGTRADALALAREHYDYCYDIVDQGVGTLSQLAAALMADDWWYFWWD